MKLTLEDVALGGMSLISDLASMKDSRRSLPNASIGVASGLDQIYKFLPQIGASDEQIRELVDLPGQLADLLDLEGDFSSFSQVLANVAYESFQRDAEDPKPRSKKKKVHSKDKVVRAVWNLFARGFDLDEIKGMDNLFFGLFDYASKEGVIHLRDAFFRERGFTDSQIKGMYQRLPQILGYSIARMANIQDAADSITEKAVEPERLRELISLYPKIYGCKLYEKIVPRLSWAVENKPGKFETSGFLRALLILSAKNNHETFRHHFKVDTKDWNPYVRAALKTRYD